MAKTGALEKHLLDVLDVVYRKLIGMGASKEDAEDVIQDTAMKFIRYMEGLDDQNIGGWLFRVAMNGYFDLCRRNRSHQSAVLKFSLEDGIETRTPEEIVMEGQAGRKVIDALSAQTPKNRQLLLLKYSAGLSLREIAGITGLKEGSVKTMLYRARNEFIDTYGRTEYEGRRL
ncbi:RNA polymerase sigma factor [Edaphobacillus lindanitolerans]|uniref:RNA polymerase sigma-70 factor, ECF subfamily n=1 Tax=Edaphobacillus lindanitolerans TaxID=550447 RepID=A0A1U7PNR4_9BACI|nr:sigma-70 family RNA polymerase sigma factor [Edaphobacillus lindanitolerans]SIT87977.1 RNA polymerase sigma-70 factor, ECF subfamily [Edaphobacillus lindanitolerans]